MLATGVQSVRLSAVLGLLGWADGMDMHGQSREHPKQAKGQRDPEAVEDIKKRPGARPQLETAVATRIHTAQSSRS